MSTHCCEMMRANVENTCEQHATRQDCPDCLLDYWKQTGTYGLMIHDGGSSIISIAFCPWCGSKLAPLGDAYK